jgi:hypothetical protein
MKTGPDVLGTTENESKSAKHENRTMVPLVPPKTCPEAQNMKEEPNTLDTAKNKSGNAKHKNGTRRPQYSRKRVQERNT